MCREVWSAIVVYAETDRMASPDTHTSSPAATALVKGGKVALFFAFAFAVMADPVSSVAYAIEAALRALNGHLTCSCQRCRS